MRVLKYKMLTLYLDSDIFPGIHFGIYFYKYALEVEFRFLYFDIYIFLGKIK